MSVCSRVENHNQLEKPFQPEHEDRLKMYSDYLHFMCMCAHCSHHNSTEVHFHALPQWCLILSSMSPFPGGTICLCLREKMSNVLPALSFELF